MADGVVLFLGLGLGLASVPCALSTRPPCGGRPVPVALCRFFGMVPLAPFASSHSTRWRANLWCHVRRRLFKKSTIEEQLLPEDVAAALAVLAGQTNQRRRRGAHLINMTHTHLTNAPARRAGATTCSSTKNALF